MEQCSVGMYSRQYKVNSALQAHVNAQALKGDI